MPHYLRLGDVPHKRHTAHRDERGALRYEELMGEEGFSSDSSLLYHRGVPSAIVDARVWQLPDLATVGNHPLRPRHLKLHDLVDGQEWKSADVVTGRRLVLGNADVRISYVAAGEDSPLYRNAVGDECVFVERGSGRVETVFGALDVAAGDFVVLPRAMTHRWVPTPGTALHAYVIEANSHVVAPKRYLSARGQFLEHAPYCERDLRVPAEPLLAPTGAADADTDVLVKHRGSGGIVGSVLTYPGHPFDVVGWDGCLYPYAFAVSDFEPITGRVHQPPPVHQVFEARNLVVCAFVPRKVDYHENSIPVPYYHSNVDSDEVMFYAGGDYEARKGSGIGLGSVSLHPGGYAHGPQPAAVEASIGTDFFDELAVMVDTFAPLELGEAARACEDPAYAWTWAGRGPS